jgi:hypothetical protein
MFKTEDNVLAGKKKIWEKIVFFCILKVPAERSRFRSWFRIRVH